MFKNLKREDSLRTCYFFFLYCPSINENIDATFTGVRTVDADRDTGDAVSSERNRPRVHLCDAQAAADDYKRGRQGADPDVSQQPGSAAVGLVRRPEDVRDRIRGNRADVQHRRRRAESKATGVRLAARWFAARRLSGARRRARWRHDRGRPSAAAATTAGFAARATLARAARASHRACTCRGFAELASRAVLKPGPDARRGPVSTILSLAPATSSRRLSSSHVALASPTVVRAPIHSLRFFYRVSIEVDNR